MLERAELTELLKHLQLKQVTAATIVNRKQLIADLERSRRRGFFMTAGENVPDVLALSVGLRLNPDIYGIALAGPMSRMREKLNDHISALKMASAPIAELSRERTVADAIR
jgi:DNA-binding IclR family transcriptional regulator